LNRKREIDNDGIINKDRKAQKLEEPNSIPVEDPPLGKGIALTLQIFQKPGMIGKDRNFGRYKDQVPTKGIIKEMDLE
jgi:hypothetical protein